MTETDALPPCPACAEDCTYEDGARIESGTKVRGIRLLESPVDGHDIAAKVPGAGQMYLTSSVVKKAN